MRRLPAEWEKQSFIQFTFPHEKSDWANHLPEVTQCFVEIISAAAKFQDVLVICDDRNKIKSYFNNQPNIYFINIPSDDTWARDHGGITIIDNDRAIVQDFNFNGWGQKFKSDLDNQITKNLFDQGIIKNAKYNKIDMTLEGGSIESDGKGTILTTSGCLLSGNRNPRAGKTEIEKKLIEYLGARQILWLDHGHLSGDDTDSHIDTLARFGNENTILCTFCHDPNDEHYQELMLMEEQLKEFKDPTGKNYQIIGIPLPEACYDHRGNRLPASYVNFTMVNNAVLVPVYGVKQDKEALKIIRSCYPKRKIIDINCRVLIEQHGSLHCITMQYPDKVKLNKKLLDNG